MYKKNPPLSKTRNRSVASIQAANTMNPIQLYQITHDGRVSDGGKMEAKNNGQLYATSTGVEEANSKSDFDFKGGGTALVRDLVRVEAGKVLADLGKKEDLNMDKWKEKALSEVEERVNEYVTDETEILMEDDEKIEYLKTKLKLEDEPFNLEIGKRIAEWRQMLLENAVNQIHQYFDDPIHQDPSRLMLGTDCGVMAGQVLGEALDMSQASEAFKYVKEGAGDETIVEWGHHVAAKIMTDGEDYVTMETAAAKRTDFFSKPPKDKAWAFRMYGSKNQSFEEEHAPLLSGGKEFIDGEWVEQEK